MSHSAPITCLIADDHPVLLRALTLTLEEAGIEVVATATDGFAALEAIGVHKPDVALLDVSMPRMSGIEVARQARSTAPMTASVLFTGLNERQVLIEALEVGARGFVLKESPLEDVVRAVRIAAGGEVYVDPVLAATLVEAGASKNLPALSSRERQMLRLLSQGRTNDQIGEALHLAPDTVRTYIKRAMHKLEADTRTQAVATAIRQAFIE
jgi:DNA-binding NarL/FixJ family response regulator